METKEKIVDIKQCRGKIIEGEIIIELPKPASKIKLVSSDMIKEHFKKLNETVPFTFVGLPYVQIKDEWYAVLPVTEK